MSEQSSLTSFLTLSALEALLNRAIELDPALQQALGQLHGKALRVRCERPSFSLYFLLYEDGIEVLDHFEGQIDLRLRGSLGSLLQWIIAPNDDDHDETVRLTGDENQVHILTQAIHSFDLWHAMREWLDQHVQLDQVIGWLKREDPRWVQKLDLLSQNMDVFGRELGQQRLLLEELLDEMQGFQRNRNRQRQWDLSFLSAGMLLLLLAYASTTETIPLLSEKLTDLSQTLLLASLGLTLILSRILFGHRR